jgi:hypothetical protein
VIIVVAVGEHPIVREVLVVVQLSISPDLVVERHSTQ